VVLGLRLALGGDPVAEVVGADFEDAQLDGRRRRAAAEPRAERAGAERAEQPAAARRDRRGKRIGRGR
jgi:hypothetical protein